MGGRLVPALLIGLALIPAYAAKKFADYPLKPPEEHQFHSRDHQLSFGLDAVRDPELLDEYFGSDLIKDGLLPVYVVIENVSGSQSFLFSTSDMASAAATDIGEGGIAELDAVPGESGGSARGVGIAGGALAATGTIFAPVAMIAAGALSVKAENSKHNILSKELRSQSISPGETIRGFVFLPVAEEEHEQRMWLRIQLKIPGRGTELQQYDFLLYSN